ncbi:MAG: Glu-tRNA(Gln) amidotransferase subunit GatE [Thermoproteota archaeon]|nr:Glu-tRNA(Gln) amidotransferase subunit GatE [Thermoproteota archaeon]
MAYPLDPGSLKLRVGFEIHQQLATKSKLFCNCSYEEAKDYENSFVFVRKLRPTQSELGAFDPAAMFEFSKMHTVEYRAPPGSSCLVDADEEPPHEINPDALETALIFSLALHSNVMDEIHVMRKMVIDGSNTTGFQRTMLVASGGFIDVAGKRVGVQSICLEEDAAKLIGDQKGVRKFGLDRLGVPLVEIALEPVTGRPSEIMQVALTLGRLLRASKRVARGLGSIRQDINISVQDGHVVEVKGVQQLDQLVKVIEYEMHRQYGLILIAQKLKEKNVDIKRVGDRIEDVSDILGNSASSRIVKTILESGGRIIAIKVPGFAGMIGFEPYADVRLGRELGKLVKFYDIDGVFHSDELPNYGIADEDVAAVKQRLQMNDTDAFVILGGPNDKIQFASEAIIRRLKAAVNGVPAETRAAAPDGKTVFLRPRPGVARMYPETDILPISITDSTLVSLADKVPRPWDEIVDSLAKKYNLNKSQASQIFDSDYLNVFEEIANETKIEPTFVAAKLTEDLTSLQRQGLDTSLLTIRDIRDVFKELDKGSIPKEAVIMLFEEQLKAYSRTKKCENCKIGTMRPELAKVTGQLRSYKCDNCNRRYVVAVANERVNISEAIKAVGVSLINDEELSKGLDGIISNNMAIIKEKGMNALSTLMGRAMAEYRGKASGQKVNAMLKDKMNKIVHE